MPTRPAALEPDALNPREVSELAEIPKSTVERAIAGRVVRTWKARGPGRRHTAERHLPPESVVFFSLMNDLKGVLTVSGKGKREIVSRLSARKLVDLKTGKLAIVPGIEADMTRYGAVVDRTLRYMRTRNALIVHDPAIMGGTPVIAGTRMTVHAVAGRVERGETIDGIAEEYGLSAEAVEAAVIYAKAHPLVGRPGGRPFKTADAA